MSLLDPSQLHPEVTSCLTADGGFQPLALVSPRRVAPQAAAILRKATPGKWFADARSKEGAMAGLWLYCGGFDEAHDLAQSITTREGTYWHAILHRMEPDDSNAAYWFRSLGQHPLFEPLGQEAARVMQSMEIRNGDLGWPWDPHRFIKFCAAARKHPQSTDARAAQAIQFAEWQLLFSWCARKPTAISATFGM